MPGIHAGSPLKSLTVRHTRSIGALMTVLTSTFGIVLSCLMGQRNAPADLGGKRCPGRAARAVTGNPRPSSIYGITLF